MAELFPISRCRGKEGSGLLDFNMIDPLFSRDKSHRQMYCTKSGNDLFLSPHWELMHAHVCRACVCLEEIAVEHLADSFILCKATNCPRHCYSYHVQCSAGSGSLVRIVHLGPLNKHHQQKGLFQWLWSWRRFPTNLALPLFLWTLKSTEMTDIGTLHKILYIREHDLLFRILYVFDTCAKNVASSRYCELMYIFAKFWKIKNVSLN